MKKEQSDYPILPLGEDWRVGRYDPLNVVLERRKVSSKGKARGQLIWVRVGYYSSLRLALEAYLEKIPEPLPEPGQIIEAIDKAKGEVLAALENARNYALQIPRSES